VSRNAVVSHANFACHSCMSPYQGRTFWVMFPSKYVTQSQQDTLGISPDLQNADSMVWF
jgi:hypothetical protein